MHRRPVVRSIVAVAAVGAALVGLPATAGAAPEPVGHYVALGDSFASGPLIPLQRLDPLGCFRSTQNYPALLADRLDVAEFTDVSCGGAVTDDMTAPQNVPFGVNPAQFDALRTDTDLVTVSIGGNDIGFISILTECAGLSFSDPFGNPCQRSVTADGTDDYAMRIDAAAPDVAAVLAGIRERSPEATVVLVGYLRILPPSRGCFPIVPISRGDVPYLDGIQQRLTTMLAEQAAAAGAVFVDPYAISLGRDTCQGPLTKWVEGIVPTRPAAPVHPNLSGMRATADLAAAILS